MSHKRVFQDVGKWYLEEIHSGFKADVIRNPKQSYQWPRKQDLYSVLLPPTNKVWGKVIFSEEGVSHSVHRASLYDVTSCMDAWSHIPSRGSLSLAACSFWGSVSGGSLLGGLCLGWSLSGGLCLEGSLSRCWSLSGVLCQGRSLCPGEGSLSKGSLSRRVSVQGDLCPGVSLSKGVSVTHPTGILSCFKSCVLMAHRATLFV